MIRHSLLLVICAVLTGGSYSSTIPNSSIRYPSEPYGIASLHPATSTDNWLGGTGNWSDTSYWSFGLPSGGSDVVIYSGGTDLVYLDASSSIASLTLGGDTGNSQLADNGTAQTLTIAGALTVNQTGTLYLAGGNAVTAGANSSNAGLIQLENASALQVNGNLGNSGTIYLGYFDDSSGSLTVTGRLDNTGLLQLGRDDSYSTASVANLGSLVNGGMIDVGPGGTLRVSGDVINSGSIGLNYISGGASSQGYFGSLVNSGGVEVAVGSTLTIAGDVNNTGGIGIDGFTQLSIGGSVNNSGSLTSGINGGWPGGWINVSGSLTNTGDVVLRNGAQLVVGGSAINSSTIEIVGGDAFTESSSASFGSLVNSGTIQIGYDSGFAAGSLTNTGTIRGDYPFVGSVRGGTFNNSGLITVGSVEAGTLTNSGSIQTYYAQVHGNFINSGDFSVLDHNSAEYRGSLDVRGSLTNSGQVLLDNYVDINIASRLTNAVTGTLSIGAYDIMNVANVVNQGALEVGPSATLNVTGGPHAARSAVSGVLNTGTFNIGEYGNLNVVGNYTQISGHTTVDGTLQLLGQGTAIFGGGSVSSEGGTINGSVFSNAAMSLYELSIFGNYTQGPNGSLAFDIFGTDPGYYSQLNISGHAQLNGMMTVDLTRGFVPGLGDTFDIMHFADRSGTFSAVFGLPINDQEHFVLEYNATDLTLDVVAGAGSVPDSQPGWVPKKSGSEPFISSADLALALAPSNPAGAGAATPEPGSLLLLGSGLLCLAYTLHRRRDE